MSEFVNRYKYDKATATEAMTCFWHHKSKRSYDGLGAMVAVFTILSPIFETYMFLIPAIIGLIGFLSLYIQQRGSISRELENIKRTFHTDAPYLKIEMDEANIRTTVSNTRKQVPLTDIQAYKETRNMYVLFLKGQLTLAMRKDSFEKGTPEAFKAWLDLQLAQKK